VRGYRWSGGSNWIILLHAPGHDLDTWSDLPLALAAEGYAVLQIDLPGHGLSDDPWAPSRATTLVSALTAHARAAGAARCFAIAAGALAGAALGARGVDALVALSPVAGNESPNGPTPPTLILVGGLDRAAATAADAFFRLTRGWAVSSTLGTGDQGTTILGGNWGGHGREQILGFLRHYRDGGGARPGRPAIAPARKT
jgi:pimeloyl-ACP methyl ester carboxylesterase